MQVETRNPQFRVRLITQQHGEITFDELRPSFLDFEVSRRLNDACGSFTLNLLPRRPPSRLSSSLRGVSWQDVLSPMDYVEISAWVPPRRAEVPLMRGFVDSVTETFSIQSGQPQHVISVMGRDYGKIMLITKLYYLGEKLPETLAIFKRWQEGFDSLFNREPEDPEAPSRQKAGVFVRPTDVMRVVFEQFYDPQLEAIRATFPTAIPVASLIASVDQAREEQLRAFTPTFSPQSWQPFSDVWSLLRAYQHAPWRELFFEEAQTGPRMIYRDAPWLDLQGSKVQGFDSTVQIVPVSLSDRIEWQFSRSDERVQNFFFTYAAQFGSYAALAKANGSSLEGLFATPPFESNPHLVGVDNREIDESALATGIAPSGSPNLKESAYQRHGIRITEVSTPYMSVGRNLVQGEYQDSLEDIRKQGVVENQRLVRAFDHGALLEFGSARLKGDERLRIGNYLEFAENGARYYLTGVSHHFRQGTQSGDGSFTTGVTFERGRGHLTRTSGGVRRGTAE